MINSIIQQPIPSQLYHHTSLEALYSILSCEDGKGICLRAVSNKYKNDPKEIKMGAYMLDRVRKCAPNLSLLQKFGGYDESASISFMEGNTHLSMLRKYGKYRLEFDLRNNVSHGPFIGGFMKCEYVHEGELKKYADEFCELLVRFMSMAATNPNALVELIHMENDTMYKVFTIKEQKWKYENEWRQVLHLKEGAPDVFYTPDGKPYKNFYLPKNVLTGVTVFCNDYEDISYDVQSVRTFLTTHGYDVPVMIARL